MKIEGKKVEKVFSGKVEDKHLFLISFEDESTITITSETTLNVLYQDNDKKKD